MSVRTGMYHFEVSRTAMYRVRYVLAHTGTYRHVLPCTRCTGFQMNALCGKTGGAIIGLRVSKQDGMVFPSSPTCLSFVRVNPPIPTQFWSRNQKILGKRIPSLKSTWMWKSQIMDVVCWNMISQANQLTDVMWQNRHTSPQQNHTLMKILSKKCR